MARSRLTGILRFSSVIDASEGSLYFAVEQGLGQKRTTFTDSCYGTTLSISAERTFRKDALVDCCWCLVVRLLVSWSGRVVRGNKYDDGYKIWPRC